MDALLKKLKFKNEQEIVVLNIPRLEQDTIAIWQKYSNVLNTIPSDSITFCMAFCISENEVNNLCNTILHKLTADAKMWFCYPKKSSKIYSASIDRDNGWQMLGDLGWEPVSIVAFDENWSALRFKKATDIKTIIRKFAISEIGKQKATKNREV